jgi:hypothetical protein
VSRRASQRGDRVPAATPPAPGASPAAAAEAKAPRRLLAAGVALAVLIAAVVAFVSWPTATPVPPLSASTAPPAGGSRTIAASHVGAETCKTCHESEFQAWMGSHHQLAMQEATPASVLGNFDNSRFTKDGVESTFFRRGDKFMVRTDGPDGKLTDYEISYTFGVYPLQQYLIPFPDGRYQMLPIAWDSRPKGKGGQRWFHLYPKQKVDHRDPLHWTGVYHNWALQCAECHSTNLRTGFDPASQTYETTWSEINVGCEACHGPASAHVEAARRATPPYAVRGVPKVT